MTDGRLTTHVLDTTAGVAAEDVEIRLFAISGLDRTHILTTRTNADGRTDAPLLAGAKLTAGTYELEFHVGGYFARSGLKLANPLFLDVVPIRFGLSDPASHIHVPLLLSPYGYSTYKGS